MFSFYVRHALPLLLVTPAKQDGKRRLPLLAGQVSFRPGEGDGSYLLGADFHLNKANWKQKEKGKAQKKQKSFALQKCQPPQCRTSSLKVQGAFLHWQEGVFRLCPPIQIVRGADWEHSRGKDQLVLL